MSEFANYKDGQVTISTYRLPDAIVTDIDDILSALETDSDEILVATISTETERATIEELAL